MSARPVSRSHLEDRLEEFFCKRVRLLGGYTVKMIPAIERGVPDRLVLLPGGGLYLVELKADHGALRPDQVQWHQRVAAIGHDVIVLTGKDEVVRWLRLMTDVHAQGIRAAERRLNVARRRAAAKAMTEDLL